MKSKRIPNLDLIRAIAIVMVLVYHTVQWLPVKPDIVSFFSQPGQYGVQLFFVLSGFLVGRLYFIEWLEMGGVKIGRFILRRISRTIPPYLLALTPAYLGSYVFENEPFRWEYLLFLQNYIETMPYFLVSWALCVEEHFYVCLPLFLGFLLQTGAIFRKILVFLIFFLTLFLRFVSYKVAAPFGFYYTASHFHLDTLFLGVLMAWFSVCAPSKLGKLHNYRYVIISISFILLLSTNLFNHKFVFTLGLSIIGITFALLVTSLSYGKQYQISSCRVVALLASSSYSTYLTHSMVIQALVKANSLFKIPAFPFWVVMMACSVIIGYVFYVLIETPLMKIRDKVITSNK